MADHNSLKALCVPENIVRRMWYGDVYKARVTHDGLPKICDLTHIQIPLTDEQLSAAVEMFNLQETEKDDFHTWFWGRVKNHVKVMLYLKENETKNMVELWHANMFEEEGTKHIYILTAPYTPYAKTIEGKRFTLNELYGTAVKIGSLIRDINNENYSHGDISLSSLYLSETNQLVLGDFYFAASFTEETQPERYKYILPPHVKEEDAVSGRVSANADIHALCSLLWNMANQIPADIRTPYRLPLNKAPEELSELLLATMRNNDNPLDIFRRSISSMLREARKAAERYTSLVYFVPSPSITYEPAPTMPELNTGLKEGELLDAIAPV